MISKYKPLFIVVAIVVTGIIISGVLGSRISPDSDSLYELNEPTATFDVKQGPLKISVVEPGTIKARDQVIIKNEVEGRRSILYLIPEGTRVQKGDLLVELDSSSLIDDKVDQEIRVQNAEASFIRARENLAVVENQAKSNVDKAELAYAFAQQDLKKYLEGEYPNKLTEAESRIALVREELLRSEEKLAWSKRLYDEKYLSQTELQQDELAVSRNKLDLEKAENDSILLKNYTHKRQVAELESDVRQAEMALERTRGEAKADVIQAEADFHAKEAEYNRQKDKLAKIEEQIEKTKIYAPGEGLVVYATSAMGGPPMRMMNMQPLDEGQEVRQRQPLIHLPATASVKAEISIHENHLEKVKVGMPVKVTIDALPGMTFSGSVAWIAPLPDPQSSFMNPDLKVYNADIFLQSNGAELRNGMSCKVEIFIEEYKDAIYVPIQSVVRLHGTPTVYVIDGKYVEPRKVEMGLDNNRMVCIISGLKPGEHVMLAPPKPTETDQTIAAEEIAVVGKVTTTENDVSKPLTSEEKSQSQPLEKTPPSQITDHSPEATPDQENVRQRFMNMSPEEMQRMRERFQNMSPEERESARQQMMRGENQSNGSADGQRGFPGLQNLSPEQRQQLRERFQNMSPEERAAMRRQMAPGGEQ